MRLSGEKGFWKMKNRERYPEWEELSDDQLIKAIRLLQKDERGSYLSACISAEIFR